MNRFIDTEKHSDVRVFALCTFSLAILEVGVECSGGKVDCHGEKSSGSCQRNQISSLSSLPFILHFLNLGFPFFFFFRLLALCVFPCLAKLFVLFNTRKLVRDGRDGNCEGNEGGLEKVELIFHQTWIWIFIYHGIKFDFFKLLHSFFIFRRMSYLHQRFVGKLVCIWILNLNVNLIFFIKGNNSVLINI